MKVPEHLRVLSPFHGPGAQQGNNGAFVIPNPEPGMPALRVIASDGAGWEHVSVSTERRTPTWSEMHHVKGLFWDPEEVVMQLHPRESNYVNNHPYVLHMWRPQMAEIPLPPTFMVGIPGVHHEAIQRILGVKK